MKTSNIKLRNNIKRKDVFPAAMQKRLDNIITSKTNNEIIIEPQPNENIPNIPEDIFIDDDDFTSFTKPEVKIENQKSEYDGNNIRYQIMIRQK